MKHGLNKRSVIHWITWGMTGITLVLWFPIITLGILKLKDFMTTRTLYQASLTSSTSNMNIYGMKAYEPEVVADTVYALIFSVEDWIMMFGALVLVIILWVVKIRNNKKF